MPRNQNHGGDHHNSHRAPVIKKENQAKPFAQAQSQYDGVRTLFPAPQRSATTSSVEELQMTVSILAVASRNTH